MLRAVRLRARLGFAIEPTTWSAIRRRAPTIDRIACGAHRRGDPADPVPRAPPSAASSCCTRPDCLAAITAGARSRWKASTQTPLHHPEGDVWTHTLLVIDQLRDPSETPRARRPLARRRQTASAPAARRRPRASASRSTATRARRRDGGRDLPASEARAARRGSASPTWCATTCRLVSAPLDAHVDAHALSRARTASTSCSSWRASTRRRRTAICSTTISAAPNSRALRPADAPAAAGHRARPDRDRLHSGPRFSEILQAVEEQQLEGTLGDRDARARLRCARTTRNARHLPTAQGGRFDPDGAYVRRRVWSSAGFQRAGSARRSTCFPSSPLPKGTSASRYATRASDFGRAPVRVARAGLRTRRSHGLSHTPPFRSLGTPKRPAASIPCCLTSTTDRCRRRFVVEPATDDVAQIRPALAVRMTDTAARALGLQARADAPGNRQDGHARGATGRTGCHAPDQHRARRQYGRGPIGILMDELYRDGKIVTGDRLWWWPPRARVGATAACWSPGIAH